MESKPHAKDWLIFQNLGKRLSIDETALPMENSTLFWPTNSKSKERNIVAMIAGTKAQTVIAIIEKKIPKLRKYSFWDNTWHGSKHGIDCQKMFP
jgi:hypothetical protein